MGDTSRHTAADAPSSERADVVDAGNAQPSASTVPGDREHDVPTLADIKRHGVSSPTDTGRHDTLDSVGTDRRRSRIDTEKSKLRRLVLDRRDALDRNMRAWKSAQICDALMLESLDAKADGMGARAGRKADHRPTVAVYAAFGSEADPSAFAQVAEIAGWRVAYPCMLPRDAVATTAEASTPAPGTAPSDALAASPAGTARAVLYDLDRTGRPPAALAALEDIAATGADRAPAAPIQRMCMRAVCRCDRAAAPFLAHPTHAFAAQDIDSARFPIVPARELDAIIVPLVAFDARGMRLGYGGGCYDRYLPTLSASCKILGIAFTEQQVEAVPVNEHDLPLPRIITA